jgi:hypothetical protein
MRKRGTALLLLSLLSLAAAAPAHAQSTAKVVECRTGKTPEARLATFEGTMKAVKGALRMQMRFELREQTPGAESPQTVKAPELSPWRRSKVGVRRFSYAQTVKGLASGVTYSSRVQFRWLNLAGKVVREEERVSGTCVQDGALPNLVLGSIKFGQGSVEGTSVYIVQVGNTGEGDAKALTVSLFADGAHIDTRTVDSLKAGEFTTVRFTGPRCARLRALADRGATVPETVEEDNELKVRCPVSDQR